MRTYDEYRRMTEQALVPMLESLGEIPEKLLEAMKYSLEAGGKRIRPVLLLAACDMAGGDTGLALPFACALEMARTALRIADSRGIRAMEIIMRRAGVTGMIAGQVKDLVSEGETPREDLLAYIHSHKTAELLEAPLEAGFVLAGADDHIRQMGHDYGYHLGLAFQMTDDLLDVTGDTAILGKSTGADAELNKMTWVALKGVEQTAKDAAEEAKLAIKAVEKLPWEHQFLTDLARKTVSRKQ